MNLFPDPSTTGPRGGPRDDTLERARRRVHNGLEEGIDCPCCGQLCRLYKRRFNSGMARIAIWLCETWDGCNWINVPVVAPVFVRRSNEVSRLCRWGLAIECPNDDEARRNSGLYKPTEKGYRFVRGEIAIPSHVHIFNNTIYGWSDQQITIRDALGARFNYAELMGWDTENSDAK